jgi:hypothetical protein
LNIALDILFSQRSTVDLLTLSRLPAAYPKDFVGP